MRNLLLSVTLLSSGCASLQPPDDWGARDTALEVVAQVVNLVDAHQTQRIRRHPELVEGGPAEIFIGPRPTANETAVYFATVGLSHYVIARWLPKKWRPWFQGGTLALSLDDVETNRENGL